MKVRTFPGYYMVISDIHITTMRVIIVPTTYVTALSIAISTENATIVAVIAVDSTTEVTPSNF
jgi:hypothetical protein